MKHLKKSIAKNKADTKKAKAKAKLAVKKHLEYLEKFNAVPMYTVKYWGKPYPPMYDEAGINKALDKLLAKQAAEHQSLAVLGKQMATSYTYSNSYGSETYSEPNYLSLPKSSPGGEMEQSALGQNPQHYGYAGPPTFEHTCKIKLGAKALSEAKTQKGKSIIALIKGGGSHTTNLASVCRNFDEAYGAFLRITENWGRACFMRPCPPRPRPGFLDSEVVTTREDIQRIWDAMIELEPKGEVIMMPFVEAEMSATFTSGLLGIGPGHEGATAGIDAIGVPVPPVQWDADCNYRWAKRVKNAKVAAHEDPDQRFAHIESVFSETQGRSDVQIRAGMQASGAGNWVPRDTTAITIIEGPVGNDPLMMIKWEATAKKLSGKPDIVVWQKGGHQGTHTALHCKANDIPVVFDEMAPVKGIVIKATGPNEDPDLQGVLDYAAAGLGIRCEIGQTKDMLRVLLVLLHGYNPSGVNARWIGLAVALMLRLGQCASLGERRHKKPRRGQQCRTTIYEKALNQFWLKRRRMNEAANSFGEFGVWQGGYGGKAWMDCTVSLADLDRSLLLFARKPSKELLGALVSEFNTCINKAHNGGWWMNKFGGKDMMDHAAEGGVDLTLMSVPFLWKIVTFMRDDSESATLKRARNLKLLRNSKVLKHSGIDVQAHYKEYEAKVKKDLLDKKTKADAEYKAMCEKNALKAKANAENMLAADKKYAVTKKAAQAQQYEAKLKSQGLNAATIASLPKKGKPYPQSWDEIHLDTIQGAYYDSGHIHIQLRKKDKLGYLTAELKFGFPSKDKRLKALFNKALSNNQYIKSFHGGGSLKYLRPENCVVAGETLRIWWAKGLFLDLPLAAIANPKEG